MASNGRKIQVSEIIMIIYPDLYIYCSGVASFFGGFQFPTHRGTSMAGRLSQNLGRWRKVGFQNGIPGWIMKNPQYMKGRCWFPELIINLWQIKELADVKLQYLRTALPILPNILIWKIQWSSTIEVGYPNIDSQSFPSYDDKVAMQCGQSTWRDIVIHPIHPVT